MSSAPILERLPSTWRMAILQATLVIGSISLCILLAEWALHRDLGRIARTVVLDDLGEFAVLYDRNGLAGLAEVFAAGTHEADQAVRITGHAGNVLFEQIPAAVSGFAWPRAQDSPALRTLNHPSDQRHLLVASRSLADGNILWFGRTDDEDRAYQEHIRDSLWLAGLGTALLSLLPLW